MYLRRFDVITFSSGCICHAHLIKKDPKLLPGMFVTASIQTGQRKVSVLLETALVQLEGKDYIFMEEQTNQFKKIPVEIGIKNHNKVEIKLPEEIKASEKIVLQGAHNLLTIQANAGE
ncbi:efflux RND transporter periplasmic adaptor subunit [Adhaeribacter radiodurans]|uniref:HlyD family efflux transporter periplasmic adaptor subunit n=1 Tax=Adhaeribacter radiodurans TaxID=2745197 RepID=A0A7L7L5W0_9BACT|nr:hypothetical protein [Adhaeribacter radiodurans]QMU28163.1 hypothetical protein HUW48_08970 [Adhaeribacter radiodurans]